MATALKNSMFKDTTWVGMSLVFVPAILVLTKVMRMNAKDEHEVHMDLRYKAVFWDRGNEFAQSMARQLLDELVVARRGEIAEATRKELPAVTTAVAAR